MGGGQSQTSGEAETGNMTGTVAPEAFSIYFGGEVTQHQSSSAGLEVGRGVSQAS